MEVSIVDFVPLFRTGITIGMLLAVSAGSWMLIPMSKDV